MATLSAVMVLEQVQSDVRTAMKARERERVAALRLVVDSLQQDAKLGKGDEVAVLQRERKKRVEAAEAYEQAGRAEQAAAERFEAELIEGYLPQQLSDQELAELVDAAIAETGASEQKQMGQVMSALMPKVGGRADGKRVSAAVREKLSG
ncbi:MAG TPA: GatB/YqeY domain-containing protein [Solirubrobacterales bacterium]